MNGIVIWGEVLFCIDASMDFCALYFTLKLCGQRISLLRLCTAAFLSAGLGVFCTAYGLSTGWSLLLLCGAWMMLWPIAAGCRFGHRWPECIRALLLFLFLQACAGGMMTAVFVFLNRFAVKNDIFLPSEIPRTRLFFVFAGVIFLLLGVFSRLLSDSKVRRLVQRGGIAHVTYNDRSRQIPCLFDSGNLVREPISGKPVMILPQAEADALGIRQEMLNEGNLRGSRLIPMKTLTGDRLLWGIMPRETTLKAEGILIKSTNMYMVFSEGTDLAIVPTSVIQQNG